MNQAQTTAVELLTLENDEYFALDDERALELQAQLAAILDDDPAAEAPSMEPREAPPILAIGAPRTVDPDRREGIPVVVATHQTGLREWEVQYNLNACIVATDLRTGALVTGRPFLKSRRSVTPEPSMAGEPPDEVNAAATTDSVRHFDLCKVLNLELRPSRLAVTMTVYDWVSNTVVVEVKGEEGPEEIEPRPPSDFITGTDAVAETPEIMSPGIALSVPAGVAEDAPLPIHAAVSLPRDSAALVPASEPGGAPLVLASVLLLKRDERFPVQIDVAAPATVSEEPEGEQTVGTFFSFDARTALPEASLSGTYQVYLVVGDRVAGPYETTAGAE